MDVNQRANRETCNKSNASRNQISFAEEAFQMVEAKGQRSLRWHVPLLYQTCETRAKPNTQLIENGRPDNNTMFLLAQGPKSFEKTSFFIMCCYSSLFFYYFSLFFAVFYFLLLCFCYVFLCFADFQIQTSEPSSRADMLHRV